MMNLGIETEVKNFLVANSYIGELREDIFQASKDYMDSIACNSRKLRMYYPSIITHIIPLNLGTTPFRKK